MEKVLFITNEVFVDLTKKEGGVRLCTLDYIKLLQCKYEVIIFPLQFNRSIFYRLKARLGLDIFEDYNENDYLNRLSDSITTNGIKKAFINLSSASAISGVIKNRIDPDVKLILCSHGFEAGDFLHQSVRFKDRMNLIARLTSSWRLGKILQKELEFRIKYFDMILTVSDVESSIENWIGAKKVFFVPRVFSPDFIEWKPIVGRVGFIGDISHFPNYFGLSLLCEAISKDTKLKDVDFRIIGSPCSNLDRLAKKYSFIKSMGYMNNEEVKTELATWMYFLNIVFYYSKGVSTKLAKGMNMGLSVISTKAGNRGYKFQEDDVITVESPDEMASMLVDRIFDIDIAKKDKAKIEKVVMDFKDFNIIMDKLFPILETI